MTADSPLVGMAPVPRLPPCCLSAIKVCFMVASRFEAQGLSIQLDWIFSMVRKPCIAIWSWLPSLDGLGINIFGFIREVNSLDCKYVFINP